jgi:hypothetical protein
MNPNTYNANLKRVLDAEQMAVNDMLERDGKSLWILTYLRNAAGNYTVAVHVCCTSWLDKRNNKRSQRCFYRVAGIPATYAAVIEHIAFAADLDPAQNEWCWPAYVQREKACLNNQPMPL